MGVDVIDPDVTIESTKTPGGTNVRPTVRLSRSGELEVELKKVWDNDLIDLALKCRRRQEALGGGVVIVSKSSALQAAMDNRQPKDRVAVKSAASVGFAMAMLPGSSLSFVHLRELLFDDQPFLSLSEDMRHLARKIVNDNYTNGLDQLGRKHLVEALSAHVRQAFHSR
jgi:hypothetical protein